MNVFPKFEYHTFYVLYPFVTSLLTLPRNNPPSPLSSVFLYMIAINVYIYYSRKLIPSVFHLECRINKGLSYKGSTIDHWRSRCRGRILWSNPYTYMYTYIHTHTYLLWSDTLNCHKWVPAFRSIWIFWHEDESRQFPRNVDIYLPNYYPPQKRSRGW
jgi:hypothetical protein